MYLMLTGGELYFVNAQRGEGGKEEGEPECLVSAQFSQRLNWIQTDTHILTCRCPLAYG